MSLSHSSHVIIREKLSGRFQSSLVCERPEPQAISATSHAPCPCPEESVPPAEVLNVADLLPLSDREFLQQAYLALLHRQADPNGMESHLRSLETGASRKAILALLRFSPEGKRIGTKVKGLGFYALYYRSRVALTGTIHQFKSGKV